MSLGLSISTQSPRHHSLHTEGQLLKGTMLSYSDPTGKMRCNDN
eukprot:CAMPEP_0169402342 /NCGR_PEP_ID=MMETSP1017-20121227/55079_1 /TAXON_ID=342587 /ORGANISM="Karlodinium micrum, Strain CCMP2283" /LENGTH=43 /DNA_ID= /DNA_START= /DNA_END= /DNA_ORIENTATION=